VTDLIKKSVVLHCGADRAFALFVDDISLWWPPSRRHTGDAASRIVLSPTGRFFEKANDGREVELGRVREWSPGARLVLDFYVGTDAAHPTEVVVAFAPVNDAETRVTVEHRPTPASAELWAKRNAKFEESWTLLAAALESFANR
jgi:hypothetical protein